MKIKVYKKVWSKIYLVLFENKPKIYWKVFKKFVKSIFKHKSSGNTEPEATIMDLLT